MIQLYKLLFLLLFCCSLSLPGMDRQPDNPTYNFITQKPVLPAASIRQTGITETIVRDAFCGGLIKPSLIAVSMFVLLANHQEGPCARYCTEGIVTIPCFWQVAVGLFCIAGAVALKCLGYTFEVTNNHGTQQAVVCRNSARLVYGIAILCALRNSDYLFEKIIL